MRMTDLQRFQQPLISSFIDMLTQERTLEQQRWQDECISRQEENKRQKSAEEERECVRKIGGGSEEEGEARSGRKTEN